MLAQQKKNLFKRNENTINVSLPELDMHIETGNNQNNNQ